jgi:[protein-PII] uridylyltransferase
MTATAPRSSVLESLPPIDNYLAPDLDRAEFLRQGQSYAADLMHWLRNNSHQMRDGEPLRVFSDGHDALFRRAFRHAGDHWRRERGKTPPNACIVAVGGYGNRALCPRSDIDILLLMEQHDPGTEAFIKFLLLLLIDFKIDLSYITRSVADCEAKVGTDVESVTSMSSARVLAGHKPLFNQFQKRLSEAVRGRGRRWYLRALYDEWRARREKYDATVYLLQPNLKEGQGGIRDVDTVRWILFGLTGSVDLAQLGKQVRFEEDTLDRFQQAIGMLLTMRNLLHQQAGAAGDLLLFEYIPEIARRLGYKGDTLRSPEEFLMADYYGYARTIDRCASRAVRMLLRGEKSILGGLVNSLQRQRLGKDVVVKEGVAFVDPKSIDYFESDPTRILAMFHSVARWGYRLSDQTIDNLTRLSPSLGVSFRLDPANHKHFMNILAQQSHVAATFTDMHESRVLGRFIPEFERLRCMVRIDHYHHFTVDEHTIKALEMAERLRNQPRGQRTTAGEVARSLPRWDLLNLALLLHDIGKGFGRGHALRGGQIAQRVCERMKLPPADADLVRFLVLSHLKLSQAAQRRDITDPQVTRQLAEEIGTLERLRMLYVLTVSDLMAVSPDAWNDWKAQLLAECYHRTADALAGRMSEQAVDSIDYKAARDNVLRTFLATKGRTTTTPAVREAIGEELDSFLREVSEYYLKTLPPDVIVRHCQLRSQLSEENLVAWHLHNAPAPTAGGVTRDAAGRPLYTNATLNHPAHTELTVYAADVPGLFSYICGAIAAKGIDIWSAQIFSTRDGFAINQFLVSDLENNRLSDDLRLDRLRMDLNQVIKGEMNIEDLIVRHRARLPKRARPRAINPTTVLFDNKSSQRYTILEIRASDRPGLLYRITRCLSERQLDIHRSIIATEAYGIVDVFYVTDMEYNKIHSEADQHKIRQALLAAIDSGE